MGENTIGDRRRWKQHYRNSKQQCYLDGLGSKAFRENYDAIRWGQSFDIEEPSESCMVYCSAGEGGVIFHVYDGYVLQDGETFVERA